MPVTKVRTKWVSGQLQFLDSTGSVLFFIDSTGKKLDFTFAKLDVSGGSTEATLGAKQVTSGVLSTAAVLGPKIKADAVSSKHIAAGAITSGLVGALAIKTAKIDNLAVSSGKIAASAITSGKLGALSVKAAKVAASAIASSAVAANAITAAKIADEALDGQHSGFVTLNSTVPFIPVTYIIRTTVKSTAAARTTATLKSIVIAERVRVIDVVVHQIGSAGATTNATLRVRRGTNSLTNAIGVKASADSILRPTTIDDAQWYLAAASTIQIRGENASSKAIPAFDVHIMCLKATA